MLDLRNLRYLVTLARRANYARAAEDIGISQPALTRSIQSLERQLGMLLFDRDRSGVYLTPQGREFVEGAAVLLENAEELERRASMSATGSQGRVRFGAAPMPARALLPETLLGRLSEAPQLINEVVVRNVSALWPLLISGEIEFFVSAEGQVPDSPPVRTEILGAFPISFIVRKGHPLLSGKSTGPFPTLVASAAGKSLPDDLLPLTSGPPHVIEDYGVLMAVTTGSDAIWHSSTFTVTNEISAGIVDEIPRAQNAFPREARVMLYSLERRTQSPGAKLLKQAFRQRIRELVEMFREPRQTQETRPAQL